MNKIQLYKHAIDVFGKEKAKKWFNSNILALNGKTPTQYMKLPGGMIEVDNILGRIEYGLYS